MQLIKFQEDNIGEPRAEWCVGELLSVAEETDIAVEVKHENPMNDKWTMIVWRSCFAKLGET